MVTVIVVAVLAVVGVAFMQSTSMDRLSSRTVADYYRAQLAAEAGLKTAAFVLSSAMTNDTFIVVANTNGQLFVGNGITNSTNFSYAPMFSTVPNLATVVAPIVTGGVPSMAVPGGRTFTSMMPGGLSVTSPPISWMYITNTNGTTNARFAYWVEDLGGKLDLSVVGTNSSGRPTGTNPAEIALWSIFNPGARNDVANSISGALIDARSNLLTAATARLVNSGVATNQLADLAANLRHDTNEPELVPFGFGYSDQGRPKYNLNTNISRLGVTNIANIINRNLPQFAQRAGGYTNSAGGGAQNASAYTPLSYLQTLAANIVDYADLDSNPTTDGTSLSTDRIRPVYRGVDSYPFVNEISKTWLLTTNEVMVRNGIQGRGIVIETTDFFELWNPSSQTANGTITLVSVHHQSGQAGFLNFNFSSPSSASNANGKVLNGISTNSFTGLSIPPNGFVVVRGSTVTNFFFSPITNSNPVILRGEVDSSRFHAAWNGVFYDASFGGLYRAPYNANWSINGLPLNAPTNRANLPGFIYRSANGANFGDPAVGDPRSTIYLSRPVDAHEYVSGTSWWGRNLRGGINITNAYAQVSPQTWPDSGHDSPPGRVSVTQLTAPDTLGPGSYSNLPPGRISNAGAYSNITELGAIFDPIQWGESSLGAWQGKWTNLTANATADNGYGGGNSLRIGRAEHPRFTNYGLRAAQLLDLFAVGPTNSDGMVVSPVEGRINLNTASTNALRAFAAGVGHVSDASLQPGGTNFVPPVGALLAFVQGVDSSRQNRPLISVNELPFIRVDGVPGNWPSNSVFGNASASIAGVSAWNDAAAEEWFAKIHGLATVRSRNFMVHVVAESVATNNPTSPLSTYRMAAQIYMAPQRTNGLTTNSVAEVIQTWGL